MVFDLDGTLAESKQRVSAEMGDALTQLLARMPVAVMSGAGFKQFEAQFFPSVSDAANFRRLYIFPDNAAQCFIYSGGKWLPQYDQAFSPQEKERIMGALKAALAKVGLGDAPVRVWGEQIEDRGAEIAFSPLGQQAPLEEKEAWHAAHNDLRKRLHEELASCLPEYANAMGGLTTIDITRKGINKAYGIRRLAELTGVAIKDMCYIGDALEEGGNDAAVIETGVPTHEVFGPEETAAFIATVLQSRV